MFKGEALEFIQNNAFGDSFAASLREVDSLTPLGLLGACTANPVLNRSHFNRPPSARRPEGGGCLEQGEPKRWVDVLNTTMV